MAFVRDGDLDVIARPCDILGVNYYRRFTVTADPGSRGAEELPGRSAHGRSSPRALR